LQRKKIISNDATRLLELKTCHRTGKNARPLSTDNHELFPGSSPPVDRELSEVSRSEQQRKVRETRETHRGVEYKERTKIGCIKHAQEKKNSTTTNKNRPQARFSFSRRQGAGRRREQQRQQPEQEEQDRPHHGRQHGHRPRRGQDAGVPGLRRRPRLPRRRQGQGGPGRRPRHRRPGRLRLPAQRRLLPARPLLPGLDQRLQRRSTRPGKAASCPPQQRRSDGSSEPRRDARRL